MKKVPSYPKITTKTNITFTQTQNININSPKSLAFAANSLSSKKMFKATSNNLSTVGNNKKPSRQRQKSSNSCVAAKISASQKSKSKILSQKGSKSTAELLVKRETSKTNLKLSKNYDAQNSAKNQQKKSGGKEEIKKLQQKLKLLEKKIDTFKSSSSKRKKQSSASQRSNSKVKESTNIKYGKPAMEQFQKKKLSSNDSTSKILKKSYSDKNVLKSRPPKMPNLNNNQSLQNANLQNQQYQQSYQQVNHLSKKPEQPQQVIHKFVTQVQKNPKMVQKHTHNQLVSHHSPAKMHYYVTNLILSLKNNDFMIYREHLIQSLQTLKYLQNVRRPTLKQLEKHCVHLHHDPKKCNFIFNSSDKHTIVLDLDQTLIHCNQTTDMPYDVSLKIKFPTGQKINAGVNIRPHAHRLLKQLSQICQIIVFTASHQCYANVVLDHLDPHRKLVAHRLFRNHCWQTQQGIYIKDLRILRNRDLQNVLLVDNAAYSYFYQLQNGIPIIPFYDDKEDEELLYLIQYVKTLIKMKQTYKVHNTLKKANHNYFKLTDYAKFNDLQKLVISLYEQTASQFEVFHA